MSQERLLRELRRASGGGGAVGSALGFIPDYQANQIMYEMEQRRLHLATELLKLGVESGAAAPFFQNDSGELENGWARVAKMALEAAAVIYPEIPEEEEEVPSA